MKIKSLLGLILIGSLTLMLSCKNDKGSSKLPPLTSSRTVFLYMAFDNSLSSGGIHNVNINDIFQSADTKTIGSNTMLILCDRRNANPELIKIYIDENGVKQKEIVEAYSEPLDLSSKEVFKESVDKMLLHAPADEYTLILGSHGSGWVLNGVQRRAVADWNETKGIAPLSVIEDGKNVMQLEDLADALDEIKNKVRFDLIIFDECLAGGVEVAYELRNKADYAITSVAEVIDRGLPYGKVLRNFYEADIKAGAKKVCETFVAHYAKFRPTPYEHANTATTALWDCRMVDDEFIGLCNKLLKPKSAEIEAWSLARIKSVQNYDYVKTDSTPMYLDFLDFLDTVYKDDPHNADLAALKTKMNAIVQYKNMTPYIFGKQRDFNRYSGMSIYVPSSVNYFYDDLTSKYKETRWYKAAYL